MKTKLNSLRCFAAITAVSALSTLAASAEGNEGVNSVVSSVTTLAGELGPVVLAGLGVALVGIGAAVAISIAKRLMGK